MRRMASGRDYLGEVRPAVRPADLLAMRKLLDGLYLDERIEGYVVDLVLATRDPSGHRVKETDGLVAYGASPRATIALNRAARAHAFLRGRAYVTPDDVRAVAADVLRHRVILTYEAEAEDVTADHVVQRVLDAVPVP